MAMGMRVRAWVSKFIVNKYLIIIKKYSDPPLIKLV
jgi:hypothetical protein